MNQKRLNPPILILSIGLLLALGFGGYETYARHKDTKSLLGQVDELKGSMSVLELTLASTTEEKKLLSEALTNEHEKSDGLQKQIKKKNSRIDTLEKLTTIDPELLKKYSKVYFLNENYSPPAVIAIEQNFLLQKDRKTEFLKDASPFLTDLLEDSVEDDVHLLVASAYRSFGTQAALKESYKVTYGAGSANQFSADQGYSEHQLGTALDFTSEAQRGLAISFDQTPEFKWLNENAYKYGFVLSYPKGNTYYQYEPWHWRFVGTDLARYLHKKDMHFYDLDQRDIDEYLIDIFE